jgi:hypothetical protein
MKASRVCAGAAGRAFPTGLKWSFMPKESGRAVRPIWWSMPTNPNQAPARTARSCATIPHTLVEGCLIASFAMQAHACYIYIRGEYIREKEALQAAIDEAYDAGSDRQRTPAGSGWDFDLYLHHGAGAYICGEETALLESLEGKQGHAADEAAVPGGRGPVRLPDDGEQCRIHRRGADDPPARGRMVRGLWPSEQRGHQAVRDLGPRQQPLRGRRGDVDPLRGADRKVIAAASGAVGTTSRP